MRGLLLVVNVLPAGALARTAHWLLQTKAALLTLTPPHQGRGQLLPFVCTVSPSQQSCVNNGRGFLLIPRSSTLGVSQGRRLHY